MKIGCVTILNEYTIYLLVLLIVKFIDVGICPGPSNPKFNVPSPYTVSEGIVIVKLFEKIIS